MSIAVAHRGEGGEAEVHERRTQVVSRAGHPPGRDDERSGAPTLDQREELTPPPADQHVVARGARHGVERDHAIAHHPAYEEHQHVAQEDEPGRLGQRRDVRPRRDDRQKMCGQGDGEQDDRDPPGSATDSAGPGAPPPRATGPWPGSAVAMTMNGPRVSSATIEASRTTNSGSRSTVSLCTVVPQR